MTADEIWMRSIDITCLHTIPSPMLGPFLSHSRPEKETHATISTTSLVVGAIACLKKFTTTALNLSFRAGNLLKACYKNGSSLIIYQGHGFVTHDLCQKLPKNPDQLVIYKLTTLQTRLFQSLDLLLYDDLESSGTHEQRWGIALRDRG